MGAGQLVAAPSTLLMYGVIGSIQICNTSFLKLNYYSEQFFQHILFIKFVLKSWAFYSLKHLKVHKIENFFDSDFGICVISLLVMHK
jgi:hypothetical protein